LRALVQLRHVAVTIEADELDLQPSNSAPLQERFKFEALVRLAARSPDGAIRRLASAYPQRC
jgi:hypothetical protein